MTSTIEHSETIIPYLRFRQIKKVLNKKMILMKYAHTHKNHNHYTTKYPI